MSKKIHNLNEHDKIIHIAEKNYNIGNFSQARKLLKNILINPGVNTHQHDMARGILAKTSIDIWVYLTGFFVIIFVAIIAFITRY